VDLESLKITIKKYLRLQNIPPVIADTLIKKLTFTNPKWIENQRMGRWNRSTQKVLRYYSRSRDGLWIPRGTLRQVILMCRRHSISYEINDQRRSLPEISFQFQGSLKDFQQRAVQAMLKKDFGTLDAPTGSGKTVMGIYMIAKRKQPALIIVHTKELAFQWMDHLKTFLKIQDHDLGLIGAGSFSIGKKVSVALVQSLYRRADEVYRHIGHLIVDECHRAPSRTFTEAVTEFDSKFMLGLSATPWRRDKLSSLIFWHIGDVHHTVDTYQLIAHGHILQAEIIQRKTDFEPYSDPVKDYSKMMMELTADDQRNRLIARDIAQEVKNDEGVCLVLSDRKKHCQTLKGLLAYKYKIDAALLTGDLTNEQRKNVLVRLIKGEIPVLIATGQLIGEGFDCKNLSTLFLTTPIRFSGRVLQYLGRILRPSKEKAKAKVYDYVDIKVGVLRTAADARQKIYKAGK
jgi:superfamily II DNA or RNA helicase